MHMMIQRSMRLKSTFIPVVACGRHRDTIARALSVLWEASITWTPCVVDHGQARLRHRSWTPCGGGSAGSGMGDANVDRGWAGRSHRSWIPAAAQPCGGGVAFVGAAVVARARRTAASKTGKGRARRWSERACGRVLVAETAPVRRRLHLWPARKLQI